MSSSVALNQPRFGYNDFGGLGQWDEIISSIAKIGTSYVTAYVQPAVTSAATNAAVANNLAVLRAQQAAVPITSSPYFIPLVGGLGLILIITMMGGKR
jgi:hypothetical protein